MIITKSTPSVLFFDSGMGGLSVVASVKERLPNLHCHYLFDHAGFPYGEKQEDFLIERVGELLEQAVKLLNIKLIVVACNTASTIVLPHLRHEIKVPIVGVVPAIKPAAVLSKRKIIGLLATPGTIHRQYTQDLIDKFASDCKVLRIGSTKLVELAENYLATGFVDDEEVLKTVKEWVELDKKLQPDVVVLGCTHFPLLKQSLKKALGEITLLDSGDAIGRRVANLIDDFKLESVFETYDVSSYAFYTGSIEAYEKIIRENSFKRYGFTCLQEFKKFVKD